jgi:hypothetical protein
VAERLADKAADAEQAASAARASSSSAEASYATSVRTRQVKPRQAAEKAKLEFALKGVAECEGSARRANEAAIQSLAAADAAAALYAASAAGFVSNTVLSLAPPGSGRAAVSEPASAASLHAVSAAASVVAAMT